MPFRSRAVGSLVELHEREMRAFLETWGRFVASGLPLPEAHGAIASSSSASWRAPPSRRTTPLAY